MEYVICAVVVCGVILLLKKIASYGNNDTDVEEDFIDTPSYGVKTSENEYPATTNIVFGALQALGCQPELKDDNTLVVSYQGETFQFDFGESPSRYTRIWDPCWAGIKTDDPQINLIKEAINVTNYNFGPTIVMTEPDENNVITFHSRYDIMVHPACPDNDQYLKSVLDSFFYAKEAVRNNFQNLNVKQAEQHKNRRPVGFAAPQ